MKALAQEINLTREERRLLMAFRAMDERRRGETLQMAVLQASHHPRRARPLLRLIDGGVA